MTWTKRIFDLVTATILLVLLMPVLILIILAVLITQGRPVFYISERMKTNKKSFRIIKFRTMTPDPADSGASGGHKANRITKLGRILRKTHLDECPQLWNVLKGDLSFVGPRPPLRTYVEKFPEIYYEVLLSRPGITGMASIYYHRHEEHLLKRTKNSEENERIYCKNCIPRKARLDSIYAKDKSICFDIYLMFKTVFK